MTSDYARRPVGLPRLPGPGSRIAGYLIEAQVGAGGMAVVFRAHEEALGRSAAVKVIASGMADDREFRARFLRESRAAAAVDSPYIIPVYSAGEADGLLYIATRFVAGGDLAGLLRRAGGRLAADRAALFVSQVASALDAAHAAGLVHRDVKPQNILVDSLPGRTEHAYLADFGLSKGIDSTGLTTSGQFLGTPDYCAPEQIQGGYVDGRTDQYALACVAFTLLTGTVPFDREGALATLFAHVNEPVPSVTRRRPDLPAAVDGVITRAMAKSAAGRYSGCGEFAAELRRALGPAGHTAGGRPSWQASGRTLVPKAGTGYANTVPGRNNGAVRGSATPGQHRGHGRAPARGRGRVRAIWAAAAAVVLAAGVAAAMEAHLLPPGHAAAGGHPSATPPSGTRPSATPPASSEVITVRVLPGATYGFNQTNAIVAVGNRLWVGSPNNRPTYSVTEVNVGDGSLVRTFSGTQYGFPVSGSGAIAADADHLWVVNNDANWVTEFNTSTGRLVRTLSGGSYGFHSPVSISDDGTHVWVVNLWAGGADASVTEFNASDGSWVRTLPGSIFDADFGAPGLVDSDGTHVWITGQSEVAELNAGDGRVVRILAGGHYGFSNIAGIVIDRGHVWVTNGAGNSVTEFNGSDGSWIRTFSGLHVGGPFGIAADGTRLWVTGTGNTVAELNESDGSFIRTLSGAKYGLDTPEAIAAEGSHVWIGNFGHTTPDGGSVTELTIG